MKYPLLGKVVAVGAVIAALLVALGAISGVVSERQGRQFEAEQSVVDGLAGSQTLLGPLLQRRCQEVWDTLEGEGRDRRSVQARRDFVLTAWPGAR